MNKILNFGSLNIDYVYSVDHFVMAGETLSSDKRTINCGGKGLNQSIAAARAGAEVYHAGKIGKDGEILISALRDNGINTEYLKACDSACGHAIIQVDKTGQNCILLFAGSNYLNTEEEIDNCLNNFGEGDYLLLQNEINLMPYIIEQAHKRKIKIIFNPSPITANIADYPIEKVSLLVLNEIEGASLSGEHEPEKILSELKKRYCNTEILLTLGENGAVYYDGKKTVRQPIFKTRVEDTTAAGDTMTGYFAALTACGEAVEKALKIASKASSITVSRKGAAASIPFISELEI